MIQLRIKPSDLKEKMRETGLKQKSSSQLKERRLQIIEKFKSYKSTSDVPKHFKSGAIQRSLNSSLKRIHESAEFQQKVQKDYLRFATKIANIEKLSA